MLVPSGASPPCLSRLPSSWAEAADEESPGGTARARSPASVSHTSPPPSARSMRSTTGSRAASATGRHWCASGCAATFCVEGASPFRQAAIPPPPPHPAPAIAPSPSYHAPPSCPLPAAPPPGAPALLTTTADLAPGGSCFTRRPYSSRGYCVSARGSRPAHVYPPGPRELAVAMGAAANPMIFPPRRPQTAEGTLRRPRCHARVELPGEHTSSASGATNATNATNASEDRRPSWPRPISSQRVASAAAATTADHHTDARSSHEIEAAAAAAAPTMGALPQPRSTSQMCSPRQRPRLQLTPAEHRMLADTVARGPPSEGSFHRRRPHAAGRCGASSSSSSPRSRPHSAREASRGQSPMDASTWRPASARAAMGEGLYAPRPGTPSGKWPASATSCRGGTEPVLPRPLSTELHSYIAALDGIVSAAAAAARRRVSSEGVWRARRSSATVTGNVAAGRKAAPTSSLSPRQYAIEVTIPMLLQHAAAVYSPCAPAAPVAAKRTSMDARLLAGVAARTQPISQPTDWRGPPTVDSAVPRKGYHTTLVHPRPTSVKHVDRHWPMEHRVADRARSAHR